MVLSVYTRPNLPRERKCSVISSLCEFLEPIDQWIIAGDINEHWSLFCPTNGNEESEWQALLDIPGVFCLNYGSVTRPKSNKALDIAFARNCTTPSWQVIQQVRDWNSDHLEVLLTVSDVDYLRTAPTKRDTVMHRDWPAIINQLLHRRAGITKTMRGRDLLMWYSNQMRELIHDPKYAVKKEAQMQSMVEQESLTAEEEEEQGIQLARLAELPCSEQRVSKRISTTEARLQHEPGPKACLPEKSI